MSSVRLDFDQVQYALNLIAPVFADKTVTDQSKYLILRRSAHATFLEVFAYSTKMTVKCSIPVISADDSDDFLVSFDVSEFSSLVTMYAQTAGGINYVELNAVGTDVYAEISESIDIGDFQDDNSLTHFQFRYLTIPELALNALDVEYELSEPLTLDYAQVYTALSAVSKIIKNDSSAVGVMNVSGDFIFVNDNPVVSSVRNPFPLSLGSYTISYTGVSLLQQVVESAITKLPEVVSVDGITPDMWGITMYPEFNNSEMLSAFLIRQGSSFYRIQVDNRRAVSNAFGRLFFEQDENQQYVNRLRSFSLPRHVFSSIVKRLTLNKDSQFRITVSRDSFNIASTQKQAKSFSQTVRLLSSTGFEEPLVFQLPFIPLTKTLMVFQSESLMESTMPEITFTIGVSPRGGSSLSLITHDSSMWWFTGMNITQAHRPLSKSSNLSSVPSSSESSNA